MKVILLKDIPKIGRRNAIVDVNEGYARNFLIPKRFAEIATDKAIAHLNHIAELARVDRDIEDSLLKKVLSDLSSKDLVIEEKANEAGHLFKGINQILIAEALNKEFRVNIDPKYIKLDKPLKTVGDYVIQVDIEGKTGTFKLTIKNKTS